MRGAFTDAIRDKAGLFEVASSGTLFLDEVGEMSPALQAKLLRALQEHEIRRVGSETSIKASPRIVAATNRDLRAAVHAGTFREDLYYRLAAFVITVPPLRERREAVPALAQEFLRRAAARFNKDSQGLAPDAMRVLLDYGWPGNVRELQHAVERAVILAAGPRITAADLPPELRLQDGGAPADSGIRPGGTGAGAHRESPRRVRRQPPPRSRGAQHQHRDPLAPHQAVRRARPIAPEQQPLTAGPPGVTSATPPGSPPRPAAP